MRAQIASKIFETDEYHKFESHPGNRGLKKAHVNNLAKSMTDHGWIDSFPMSVRKTGRTFVIVDGHNRFHAAQSASIPVKYALVNGEISDDELCMVNRTQKRWTTADFVKSYANQGKIDYVVMQSFMDEFHVGTGVASCLLEQGGSHGNKHIEEGRFKVADEKWARDKVHWLIQINHVLPFTAFKRNFVDVFAKACLVDGFDPARLLKQMKKNPASVMNLVTQKDIAQMFEDVYNYGYAQKNKIPLAFLIDQVRATK